MMVLARCRRRASLLIVSLMAAMLPCGGYGHAATIQAHHSIAHSGIRYQEVYPAVIRGQLWFEEIHVSELFLLHLADCKGFELVIDDAARERLRALTQ